MKIKTSELNGPALDWAVAKCVGLLETMQGDKEPQVVIGRYGDEPQMQFNPLPDVYYSAHYSPSARWEHAGPIVERENISLARNLSNYEASPSVFHLTPTDWQASLDYSVLLMGYSHSECGPTPLIAAMRCYCCAKLGDEIDIPEELCPQQQT